MGQEIVLENTVNLCYNIYERRLRFVEIKQTLALGSPTPLTKLHRHEETSKLRKTSS